MQLLLIVYINIYIIAINEIGRNDVIPSLPIDPPMMSISVGVNSSPIAGKEGSKMGAA